MNNEAENKIESIELCGNVNNRQWYTCENRELNERNTRFYATKRDTV